MSVSAEYLEYVLDQLSSVGSVEHKRMFGGIGIYFDGLFFALIDDDILYFKVDDLTRQRYEDAGSKGFDPFKNGQPSRNYFTVPVSVLEDLDELRGWTRDAIGVAGRALAKKQPATKASKKKGSRKTQSAGKKSRTKNS